MIRITIVIIAILITQGNMIAQESNKKILLTKGHNKDVQYKELHLSTLLQVYEKTSPAHLIGDIYLRVDSNDKIIAEFYMDNDQPEETFYTKIYKNYLLTFLIENNNKYLIIEQAQFGKTFALSSKAIAIIGTNDEFVEIEITDFHQEWGYDAPAEDDNRDFFDNVQYTLKVKARNMVKNFSFYSSELEDNYTIDIGRYNIKVLSHKLTTSSSFIEMVINKKEEE